MEQGALLSTAPKKRCRAHAPVRTGSASPGFRAASDREMSQGSLKKEAVIRRPPPSLFSVRFGDLTDKRGPLHIERSIKSARFGTAIVLQNFHHERGIIRDDDPCLLHTQ
jgi:hypothetical protein